MNYTAFYKKPRGLFWHKIKNVKADAIYEARTGEHQPVRVLVCEDETRYEIPMALYLIKFSKERFLDIKQKAEQEAGQKIPTTGD